jgi:hypothetical protein
LINQISIAENEAERFERGAKVLASIDGKGGQTVVDSLADISPELRRPMNVGLASGPPSGPTMPSVG